MNLKNLHPQDQLIVAEALAYWAYFHNMDEFDRSDPRRNRAAELAGQILQDKDLPEGDFSEIVDQEWTGPNSASPENPGISRVENEQ